MEEYQFKVSKEEATTIINALAQMPYGMVVGVMNKLQNQTHEQHNKQTNTLAE